MSNSFCVNKSGKSVPVYSDTKKTKQIGTIYNREAFGYNRNWGGDGTFCNIVFQNSSGNVVSGFMVNPPAKTLTGCDSYPYGTAIINKNKYITFIMRDQRNVYTVSARKWGTVPKNCRVACKTAESGDTHPDWKGINYIEDASGKWVKVTGDGGDYGFVDTGLSKSSLYSAIPFYGKW